MFEKTLNIYLIFLSIKYKTKKKKKKKERKKNEVRVLWIYS